MITIICPSCSDTPTADNGAVDFTAFLPCAAPACQAAFRLRQPVKVTSSHRVTKFEEPVQLPLDLRMEFERQDSHLRDIRLAS